MPIPSEAPAPAEEARTHQAAMRALQYRQVGTPAEWQALVRAQEEYRELVEPIVELQQREPIRGEEIAQWLRDGMDELDPLWEADLVGMRRQLRVKVDGQPRIEAFVGKASADQLEALFDEIGEANWLKLMTTQRLTLMGHRLMMVDYEMMMQGYGSEIAAEEIDIQREDGELRVVWKAMKFFTHGPDRDSREPLRIYAPLEIRMRIRDGELISAEPVVYPLRSAVYDPDFLEEMRNYMVVDEHFEGRGAKQFTLDVVRGRNYFINGEPLKESENLFEQFINQIGALGVPLEAIQDAMSVLSQTTLATLSNHVAAQYNRLKSAESLAKVSNELLTMVSAGGLRYDVIKTADGDLIFVAQALYNMIQMVGDEPQIFKVLGEIKIDRRSGEAFMSWQAVDRETTTIAPPLVVPGSSSQ